LTPYDPAYVQQLGATIKALTPESGTVLAEMQAQALIYNNLQSQARLWAFVENFRLFGFLCLGCLPLIWLFKKAKPGAGSRAPSH
jgi:DHA2 family multidrug resistance protein